MPDISVSEPGILQVLNNLKTSKAVGPDGILPRILKEAALEIAPIFQDSIPSEDITAVSLNYAKSSTVASSIDAGFQTDVFILVLRRLSTPCLVKD